MLGIREVSIVFALFDMKVEFFEGFFLGGFRLDDGLGGLSEYIFDMSQISFGEFILLNLSIF